MCCFDLSSLKEGTGGSFLLRTENLLDDQSKADGGNVELIDGQLVVLVDVRLRESLVLNGTY